MDYTQLLNTVAMLFLMLLCGFIARRVGIIRDEMISNFSTLVIKVCQPFMIVGAMVGVEYSAQRLRDGFTVLLACFAMHAVFLLFAHFAAKVMKDPQERKVAEFCMIFNNCGYIGFPILRALFGDIGVFRGAFYIIGFQLIVWTLGVKIFARGRSDIKISVRSMLLNYGTVPCVIGLLLYVARLPIPGVVTSLLSGLGDMCTPLTMLITGALIATRTPRQIFLSPKIYYISAQKLLVLPLLCCLLCRLFGLPEEISLFSTVMAALPSAAIASMFGELYGVSPGFAAQTVGTTSLLSSFTLPVVISVAQLLLSR